MKFFSLLAATLVAVSSAFPTTADGSLNNILANTGDASTTPFYITAPLENATYHALSTVTTTWLNGIDEQFTIVLLTGENPASMKPTGLNLTANGKTGTYAWMVPKDLVGGTYAFQYVFNLYGIMSDTYSNQFKVLGNSTTVANSTSSAASAASTVSTMSTTSTVAGTMSTSTVKTTNTAATLIFSNY